MDVHGGKVSTKGQVTLPKDFREDFDVKPGDEVVFLKTSEGILVKPRRSSLRALRGLLKEEIDVEKAGEFIKQEREKWRLSHEEVHD